MTDTPKPDIAAIRQRHGLRIVCDFDIPALLAYIESLQAEHTATVANLIENRNGDYRGHCELRDRMQADHDATVARLEAELAQRNEELGRLTEAYMFLVDATRGTAAERTASEILAGTNRGPLSPPASHPQAEDNIPGISDTCWCSRCDEASPGHVLPMRMNLCPKCGNKRCPKAEWHGFKCSGSNEPSQPPGVSETQGAEAPERFQIRRDALGRLYTTARETPYDMDLVRADLADEAVEALEQARAWLKTITGAAFFGPTAPDTASMQFTITLNAAEWREMRAIVDGRPIARLDAGSKPADSAQGRSK